MPLSARFSARAASFSAACDSISLSDEPFDDIWLCVPRSARALRSSSRHHTLPVSSDFFLSSCASGFDALDAVSVSGSSGIDLASRALSAISWPSTSLLKLLVLAGHAYACLPSILPVSRAALARRAPLNPSGFIVSSSPRTSSSRKGRHNDTGSASILSRTSEQDIDRPIVFSADASRRVRSGTRTSQLARKVIPLTVLDVPRTFSCVRAHTRRLTNVRPPLQLLISFLDLLALGRALDCLLDHALGHHAGTHPASSSPVAHHP
ncbi:hypothetical protein A0H81_05716 [Grifola frondosa]|uniref:Uncharacterized protein n=1 Tax=Grifola frondosa TaxID=5627 RepID=A0A1C7MBM5_GRIFR|nr:hypothetical protein A0H81_05716 [Grifola frondosa]